MPDVGHEMIDPIYYERYGYPHASWEFLRRHRAMAADRRRAPRDDLGANLARLELQEIVLRLVPRLGEVELAGPIERMRSSFVGGIKHMPIRYRLRA